MSIRFNKAIVIGASSGIGEAVARQLAAQGAQVALVARRADLLDSLAQDLDQMAPNDGRPAKVYPHDVTRFAEVPALFERIVADLGGVDCVVYAAGILHDPTEGEYDTVKDRETIEVNLLGAMAWLTPAAARFEAARGGTLIGISSIAGERGRRGNPAYCTSKAAFTTYLESLRNRTSRYGVNVVTVKPGFIDTGMIRGRKVFWVISPDRAARETLDLARRGDSASGFVPGRWGLVALILHHIPSAIFRRLNF